jgi:hypothetical protein
MNTKALKNNGFTKLKTFKIRVDNNNWGWITLNNGEVVSCSQRHSWALHLPFYKLDNWLSKKGKVCYLVGRNNEKLGRNIANYKFRW